MHRVRGLFVQLFVLSCLIGAPAAAFADGDETLGSIVTTPGSGFVAAGVGLRDVQPGTIELTVPAGVTVEQVLLYWQTRDDIEIALLGDDTIVVETMTFPATEITGDLIGMAEAANGNTRPSFGYRADITGLGIISAGTTNRVDVSGLVATHKTPGAAIVAIISDGVTTAFQDFRDGVDFAFIRFGGAAQVTVPQTYNFPSSDVPRDADLLLLLGDAEADRADIIEITVDGVTSTFCNTAVSSDGPELDVISFPLTIPALATSVTVELFSLDCGEFTRLPDSLTWLLGALSVQEPAPALGVRVTGGGVDQFEDWTGDLTLGHCPNGNREDRYTFGGQAGAPTGAFPQPYGEWTHHQQRGPSGRFVFHAGTSSASEGTEISLIESGDPDFCDPARFAPAKQIRFEGVGEFQNIHNNTEIPGAVERETLHFFCVRINDAGEPGRAGQNGNGRNIIDTTDCPVNGYDVFSDPTSLVDCDCPDFYEIKIFATANPPAQGEEPIYHVFGYPAGGNLQIHPSLD